MTSQAARDEPEQEREVPAVREDDLLRRHCALSEERRREVYGLLSTIVRDDLKLPILPANAQDALALAVAPDPEMSAIKKVIESDPLMAGRMMAAANSALYAGHGMVNSLRAALARLGVKSLQELLMRVVTEAHAFGDATDGRLATLRRHSLLTAHVTKKLCVELEVDAEYAFACGLFHDVGQSIMIELLRRHRPTGLSDHHDDELLDVLHPVAGERILAAWNLPPLIVEVALYHHAYGSPNDPGGYSYMSNIVAVADRIAYCVGVGDWPADNEYFAYTALEDLQLAPERCGQLMQWAESIAPELT